MNEVIVGLLSAVFAGGAGFTACKVMVEKKLKEKEEEYNKVLSRKEEIEKLAKEEAERIKKEAEKEVERILKEAEREAKIRASEIEKEALKLGAVVEIMHSFLLVHDDIIDNSVLRRGEPTLHKVYESIFNSPKLGIDTAIVVGDLVSFLSVGIISELNVSDETKRELLRSFSNCYVKTCFGQLLDIITSNRINDEYIKSNIPKKISEMKTAYYTFIYPMILGYYLSEKDEKNDKDEKSEKIEKSKERELGKFREIELITNAGLHAGIAFQYKDDIIGVFGGDEKTLNDLSEGKLTSIVKKTYENLTGKEKETFIELIKKQEKT
ncbi:MAG: polyprenyl synthetase family protein, partial [Sulfurihydrogenibium azorense]